MTLNFERVLVTGAAGFIGYHLALRLLKDNCRVTGLDILNDYYDVNLKKERLRRLKAYENFSFSRIDLSDGEAMNLLFKTQDFDVVVNLAAQAGVRYSLTNPQAYVNSNLVGFTNILECCRHAHTAHVPCRPPKRLDHGDAAGLSRACPARAAAGG